MPALVSGRGWYLVQRGCGQAHHLWGPWFQEINRVPHQKCIILPTPLQQEGLDTRLFNHWLPLAPTAGSSHHFLQSTATRHTAKRRAEKMQIPTSAELTAVAWSLPWKRNWRTGISAQLRWLNQVEGSPDEQRKTKPEGAHQDVWKKWQPPMALPSSAAVKCSKNDYAGTCMELSSTEQQCDLTWMT